MSNQVKYWGSFTLLSGLGATLVAGLLAWVFSTTLENKITFAPLTASINGLIVVTQEQKSKNAVEHNMIVDKLQKYQI